MSLLPPNDAPDVLEGGDAKVCIPEHCFHAFDALYCALTHKKPIPPQFPDDK